MILAFKRSLIVYNLQYSPFKDFHSSVQIGHVRDTSASDAKLPVNPVCPKSIWISKGLPNSVVAASVEARKPSTSAHDDCSNDENNFRASFPLIRHLHLRQSPHKPRIQGWSANAKVPNSDIADVDIGGNGE